MAQLVRVRGLTRDQSIRIGGKTVATRISNTIDLDDPVDRKELTDHIAIGRVAVLGDRLPVQTNTAVVSSTRDFDIAKPRGGGPGNFSSLGGRNIDLRAGTVVSATGPNVVTVATGAATAGTFTLSVQIDGRVYGPTAAIAYNSTAAAVAAAVNAILPAGVTVAGTGGALPGAAVTLTFTGTGSVPVVTGSGAGLTGGAFAITGNVAGAAQTVAYAAPDPNNTRIDLIQVNSTTGVGSVVTGTALGTGAVAPAAAGGNIPCWEVTVPPAGSARPVTLKDVRPLSP